MTGLHTIKGVAPFFNHKIMMNYRNYLFAAIGILSVCAGYYCDNISLQFVGSALGYILYLWDNWQHRNDEKTIADLRARIDAGDEALNIERDADGNVTNNPYEQGVY